MRILFVAVVILGIAFGNLRISFASASEQWTVEQTLERARSLCIDPSSKQRLRFVCRAHPAAREGLYRMLADPRESEWWPMTVALLAYITGPDDVPRLREFIFRQKGVLSDEQYSAICAVFSVLTNMAVRGIREGQDEIWKMVRPAYWREVQFSLAKSPNNPLPRDYRLQAPIPIDLAGQALVTYAVHSAPEAARLIEEALDAGTTDEERYWLAIYVKRATNRLYEPRETREERVARRFREYKEREERHSQRAGKWTAAVCSGSREDVFLAVVGACLVLWLVLRLVRARRAKARQPDRSGPAPPLEGGEEKA